MLEPAVRSLDEQAEKLGESLRVPIEQFAAESSGCPRRSILQAGRRRDRPDRRRSGGDGVGERVAPRGVDASARIETMLDADAGHGGHLEAIKRGLDRAGLAIESLAGSWSPAYERSSRATQEQLARTLTSLKDALEMLNVSMEQGNALYRNIVKKMFDDRASTAGSAPALTRSGWRERLA